MSVYASDWACACDCPSMHSSVSDDELNRRFCLDV